MPENSLLSVSVSLYWIGNTADKQIVNMILPTLNPIRQEIMTQNENYSLNMNTYNIISTAQNERKDKI